MTPQSFTIPFLLATDYGNLWAFLLILPTIGVCILLGTIFWVARKATARRVCGFMSILLSVFFLSTIGDAREFDRLATLGFSVAGAGLGVLLMRVGAKIS